MIANLILVVDDNRHAADSLGLVLRHWGYRVLVAYDGPSALELAEDRLPRAVILDLEMPTMSGFEVARQLRECRALGGLVLIALSGHDVGDQPGADFNFRLSKPLRFEHLRRLLGQAVGLTTLPVATPQP